MLRASGQPSSHVTPQKPSTPVPEYVEQEWQKAPRADTDADLEWAAAENGDDSEEWECVACGKSFRSEAAWDSHERSKKHIQAIELLKEAMLEENEELDLGAEGVEEGSNNVEVEEPPDSPPLATVDTPEESHTEMGAEAEVEVEAEVEAQETVQETAHRSRKKPKKIIRTSSPELLTKIARRKQARSRAETPDIPETPEDTGTPSENIPAYDVTSPDITTTPGEEETAHTPLPELSK